jgi:hypothetical protein
MTNDVRAGLVHTENHERTLFVGKRIGVQKIAHPPAHQGEIAGVAAKFDLLPIHRASGTLDTGCSSFKDKIDIVMCMHSVGEAVCFPIFSGNGTLTASPTMVKSAAKAMDTLGIRLFSFAHVEDRRSVVACGHARVGAGASHRL